MTMLRVLYSLFFLFSFAFSSEHTLTLNNTDFQYDDFKISYYKDINDLNTIDSITQKDFTTTTQNGFAMGFVDGSVWMKFDISNKSDEEYFILSLNEVFYEKADLYLQHNNQWIKKENSLFTLLKDREIKTNKLSFKIKLQKYTT